MSATEAQQQAASSVRGRIKEQKAALIQEEILVAAARLIASRGIRAVTVDDISAEMGFTKSIVYYYLKNKNEILWRIFEKIDETYANGLDDALHDGGSPVEQMANVMRMHCMNVLTYLDWATIYNRDLNELTDEQRAKVEEKSLPGIGIMPCSLQNSATDTPTSAWRRIARIWGSLYIVIFIQNLLMHFAKKNLRPRPLTFGGEGCTTTPLRNSKKNAMHDLRRGRFLVYLVIVLFAASAAA